MQRCRLTAGQVVVAVMILATTVPGFGQTTAERPAAGTNATAADEVSILKDQLAAQQKQLEQMQANMTQMKARLDRAERASAASQEASIAPPVQSASAVQSPGARPASLRQVASLSPVVPKAAKAAVRATTVVPAAPASFFNNGASPADEQGTSPLSVKI